MKTTKNGNTTESTHVAEPLLGEKQNRNFFSASLNSKSFFGPSTIQPRLKVGQPNDKYEQEADRMADAVMRMPDPQIQRQPEEEEELQMKQLPNIDIHRKCEECEKEEKVQQKRQNIAIQRKCKECEENEQLQKKSDGNTQSANHASSKINSQLSSRSGRGSRLPKGIQSEMGNKMGADFSGVNIHTDSTAHQMSQQLGARAFTHGSDIYFNRGEYNPSSNSGKRLLAHELTHVVQQKPKVTQNSYHLNSTLQMNSGKVIRTLSPSMTRVQKQESEEEDSDVIDCMVGLAGGEFIENPGMCQIITETLVGLIPYVDQVMDVRDLLAHIYYLAFRDQLERIGRWIGVVFTLIGAIPEVGTLIKGVSKTIRRYSDVILEGAGNILRRITPTLSEFGINLRRHADDLLNDLRRLLHESWSEVTTKARRSWNTLVDWFKQKIDTIPNVVISVSSRLQRAKNGIDGIRRASDGMIESAFNRARETFRRLIEELQQRFGRRREGPEIAPDVDEAVEKSFERTFDQRGGQTSISGDAGRRQTEYPYLNRTQLAAARRLLGNRIDEIPAVRRVWEEVANQGERQLLTLSNSRRLFNNHRNRFWRAVRNNEEARTVFESAGFVFSGGRTTAPVHRDITGRAGRISLDHIMRRADDPQRALEPENLRLIVHGDNTLLENIQQAIPTLRQ